MLLAPVRAKESSGALFQLPLPKWTHDAIDDVVNIIWQ